MGKKSYTKGKIRMHHLIAKAKQAYLVARMGVGKDCKDYQEDLWNLEAFQEAKWGSSRKNRRWSYSRNDKQHLSDATQESFGRIAKYYKGLFPGVTLNINDFKSILNEYVKSLQRKSRIRNDAAMTSEERELKKRSRYIDYTARKKLEEKKRCQVKPFDKNNRIMLRGDGEPYQEVIGNILKAKLKNIFTPEVIDDIKKEKADKSGSMSFFLNFHSILINGKLVFFYRKDHENNTVTDAFTGKIYKCE